MKSSGVQRLRKKNSWGLLLGLLCVLSACVSGTQKPYPVPKSIHQAPEQRQEFVGLFLQGWWGEAEAVFQASLENYISQDDFCAAARNYVLAYRLLKYIDKPTPYLLKKARRLQSTGQRCPGVLTSEGSPISGDKNDKYAVALGDMKKTKELLKKEDDPLYFSVYARKAAEKAYKKGLLDESRAFVHMAREVDSRQGWVVFLVKDWQLMRQLSGQKRGEEIERRIKYLSSMIVPGERMFGNQKVP